MCKDVDIKLITKKQIRELLGDLLKKDGRVVDSSRSGVEWSEVCSMVKAGYNYEDCDREMRLFGFEKWIEANLNYRVGTYCRALMAVKGTR